MESAGKSKALNVLGVFLSVILSILFVFIAFIVPIYYSVAGLIMPKTITTVIQKIDYVEVLQSSEEVNNTIKEIGIDAEIANEVMKSKEVGVLLEDFSSEVTTVLSDPEADLNDVDAPFVQEVVDRHIDDIVPVVEKESGAPVQCDKVKSEITKVIKSKDKEIKQMALELQPIKETVTSFSTITKTIQTISKWQYILLICLLEILLLALIYFIRRKNYGGFIWIAVGTGIVGVLVSSVAIVFGSGIVKSFVSELPQILGDIVSTAVGTIVTKLVIALVVCFMLMAISIAACIVLRTMKTKKTEQALPESADAEIEKTEMPIEEPANA